MISLPSQMLIEARMASHGLADPAAEVKGRLEAALVGADWTGLRVGVVVGSRGIDRLALVVKAVVATLIDHGAVPFIIPAMGSHGGATAEGQVDVLAALGVTDETVGAPIRSSMDTVELGHAPQGFRVLASRDALQAEAIVLINRVKPHTDFASTRLGSGLLKMSAIGLGKAAGAAECHTAAVQHGHEAVIREASRLVLARLPRVLGVALVEDAHHRLARVEAIPGPAIEATEPGILAQAREWMPSLPLPEIDVLILDEMGKNVSGAGMDTNIVGRGVDGQPRPDRNTTVKAIYVRGLTEETHGNAAGVGLADVVSARLVASMDKKSTYTNALSAMTPGMARTPMHFDSDAECISAALRVAGASAETARIVRVRNTLALDRLVVSSACAAALQSRSDLHLTEARPWRFDAAGDFDPRDDLLRG